MDRRHRQALLFILQWLHRYIPNWGWTIIASHRDHQLRLIPSEDQKPALHAADGESGPEIRPIQDRYKKYSMSDPRKRHMNEEVMAIYQREGINPVGDVCPCCRNSRSGGRFGAF